MSITMLALTLIVLTTAKARSAPPHNHARDPITREAKRWKPERWWLRQAFCIHRRESVDWHLAGRDWSGRPSPYYGGMQFLVNTWQRAGGTRLPSDWAPREQLYRAWRIYRLYRTDSRPGSWSEWGTAGACGVA